MKESIMIMMLGAVFASSNYEKVYELDILDPNGVGIYLPMHIGTTSPDGFFTPQIDSGSCNLVLPSVICKNCNADRKYALSNSDDFHKNIFKKYSLKQMKSWALQRSPWTRVKNYLGARFETVYVRDYIYLKGVKKKLNMYIEVIIDDRGTRREKQQGILGLCPQSYVSKTINENDQYLRYTTRKPDQQYWTLNKKDRDIRHTLPRELKAHGIALNQFSIYLPRHSSHKPKFVFGGVMDAHKKLLSDFRYFSNHAVEMPENRNNKYQSDMWALNFKYAIYGGKKLSTTTDQVILDTGCTLHQANAKFLQQLLAIVQSKYGLSNCMRHKSLICMCSEKNFKQLPDLTFDMFGGKFITVSKDSYAQFTPKFGGLCALMFQEAPADWSLLVMGLPFFREYYTLFNGEQNKIGLYPYAKMK